jgi:glycolate dehydrogenase FAD-binding subunit
VTSGSLARGLARLTSFAEQVGTTDPVTVAGLGTRGGAVPGIRVVSAPVGIDWIQPAEMTVSVGAGTPVDDLDGALREHGQRVALPPGGTVGGALAVGRSGIRRLGDGPARDAVLQVRYVSAAGEVVKGGGPTVKNVSGFDLPRLLVGSRGTLGFLGDVILRTRPRARCERWYAGAVDPDEVHARLYRPVSVLWDGTMTWALVEGDERDVDAQVAPLDLAPVDGPPMLPTGGRWSLPPGQVRSMTGAFIAEVGVGVVHHSLPAPPRVADAAVVELHRRLKERFDPTGRLNPSVDPLDG